MSEPHVSYDAEGDTLYISFLPGRKATGVELNDHILLRIAVGERELVGITILDYSIIAQRTELGPRSFPASGLAELSDELRELVMEILLKPPASDFLSMSAYTPSSIETIPITQLHDLPLAAGQ